MKIKEFKIHWMHIPNTKHSDDYVVIVIDGAAYRTDDPELMEHIYDRCKSFVAVRELFKEDDK